VYFMLLYVVSRINHILIGINIIPKNVQVKLIDIFIILVDGSNTE
jgi:hypothetical protein